MSTIENNGTRHYVTITTDVLRDRDVMVELGSAAWDAFSAVAGGVAVFGDIDKGTLTVTWVSTERPSAALAEIDRLRDENAALREAGDRLAESKFMREEYGDMDGAVRHWVALTAPSTQPAGQH